MKKLALTLAALALAVTAQAHGGGGGGHGGGGGGFGGGGHGGGGFGGGHGGGGFHGGGHGGGYHGGGHWRGGVYEPIYVGGGYGGYYDGCGYYGCGDSVGVACAPEVIEGNVATTDRVMTQVAATPEFATAKTFQSEVKQATAIKNAGERAEAYMQLAGIDPQNKAQVADFVGARDAKGAWITDLQRNADLTSAQAETVALKLQTALRGNLQ